MPDSVDLFLDGSALAPTLPGLTRAGWAVVAMRPGTASPLFVCFGHLPGRYEQAAGGGELFAFMMALRLTAFPGVLYTDFQHLIDGLERGKIWCTSPERRYATSWTLAWAVLDDMVMPEVLKVKAHSAYRADAPPAARRLRAGNVWADAFAKAGAAKHPSNAGIVEEHVTRAKIAGMVLRWAGEALAHWPMVDAATRAGDAEAM